MLPSEYAPILGAELTRLTHSECTDEVEKSESGGN